MYRQTLFKDLQRRPRRRRNYISRPFAPPPRRRQGSPDYQLPILLPTAILCAPTILGVGYGPVEKRSVQVPIYIDAVLKKGKAFTLGDGQNIWDYVYVNDVADAFIKLTEEALGPDGGNTDWGMKGYYFCEAGEYRWGDFHKKTAEMLYAKGAIRTPDGEETTADGAIEIRPWGPILWGGNASRRVERLRKLFMDARGGER